MANEIARKKLALYEEFYEKMRDLDEEEANMMHNYKLEEQYKNSKIEENFIYLDEMRDLKELNIKEQKIIGEQNNLYNYSNLKTQASKLQNVYSIAKYVTYIPRWIPFT